MTSFSFSFWYCIVGVRYSRGHLSVAEEVEGRENDEKRLLRHLMRGYERDVRPVKNASTPVVIQLSITLTQIFDMVRDWDQRTRVGSFVPIGFGPFFFAAGRGARSHDRPTDRVVGRGINKNQKRTPLASTHSAGIERRVDDNPQMNEPFILFLGLYFFFPSLLAPRFYFIYICYIGYSGHSRVSRLTAIIIN